jgi:hypothetical protein
MRKMIIDFKKRPNYYLQAEALLKTYPEAFSKESININDITAEFVMNIFGIWNSSINVEMLSYDFRMGGEIDFEMSNYDLDDKSLKEVVNRILQNYKNQSIIKYDKYIIGRILEVIDDVLFEFK